MCQGSDNYQYSDPLFVGGASGSYTVQSPIPQGFHSEWAIIAVASANPVTVLISADIAPNATPTIAMDGSVNYSNPLSGVIIRVNGDSTYAPPEQYFPLKTDVLSLVIATDTNSSTLVTVRFRWRITPLTTLNRLSEEPDVDDWQEHRANVKHADEQETRLVEMMTHVGRGNFYGR